MAFDPRTLEAANRKAVLDGFERVAGHLRSGDWLGQTNRYGKDAPEQFHVDVGQGSVHAHDLAEYCAASVATHAFDGWTYLGRSLASHFLADGGTAAHLAYYAELRAAMAILAAHGITILQKSHGLLVSDQLAKRIPDAPGTHGITWEALSHWGNLADPQLVLSAIKPGGRPLGLWLSAMGITEASRTLLPKWLATWGLDISRLIRNGDKAAREHAAYRPGAMPVRPYMSALENANGILAIWNACRPGAGSTFPVLDRHLLRIALETEYARTLSKQPGYPSLEEAIAKTIGMLSPEGPADAKFWLDFLLRRVEPHDLPLFDLARAESPVTSQKHHLEAAARATLLLRIATGASEELLAGQKVRLDELAFWIKPLLHHRALWQEEDLPNRLADLWREVAEPLESLAAWACPPEKDTRFLHQEHRQSLAILSGIERAGLWGLGI